MSGLLPCPFCGGKAVLVVTETSTPRTYAVECEGPCMCEGPPDWDEAEAIAAWNRRAAAPADVGEEPAVFVLRSDVEKFDVDAGEIVDVRFFPRGTLRPDNQEPLYSATALERVVRERDEALADRAAQAERIRELEEALRNLAHEMRFLLRNNPKMDGGLYRQRLSEADGALAAFGPCPHNCDVGGICLAGHAGFPESCARAKEQETRG